MKKEELIEKVINTLKSRGLKDMQPLVIGTLSAIIAELLEKNTDDTIREVMLFCNPGEEEDLINDFIELFHDEKEMKASREEQDGQ